MNPREPDADDRRLRARFRAAPPPAAPADLAERVRRCVRANRQRRVALAACAASALLALVLLWPRPGHTPEVAALPDAAPLFAGPPVDGLAVVTAQRDAYLTLLDELPQE